MKDERKLPDKQSIEQQRRSRMWYVDYPEEEEYDFEPEWADDIEQEDEEDDSGKYTINTTTFKSIENDDEWISSTKKYDLMRMR